MTTATNKATPKETGENKKHEENNHASNLEGFLGSLPPPPKALSIEVMNEVTRAAWADEKKGLQ